MSTLITPLFSYATIVAHAVFVVIILAAVFYRSWGRPLVEFIGRHALVLGFLAALSAVVGSLLYSGVVGYAPCELCWWQRIFLYPQVVLFGIALYKRDGGVFAYSVVLSTLAGAVALYHSYIQLGGTHSVLPCTAEGAACAKVFVNEFGYITIPTMALTVAVGLLLIALCRRLYKRMS
ncbi:MAG: disulfide bond formation protein DsbB [Parcubacteria group bacterium]|nr:disulfide bond formation protein DsbB [Parcubacteria group bacterium]